MNSHFDPWKHRHFQKDKLRVKERYYHQHGPTSKGNGVKCLVVPDGRTWRRYLTVFQKLVESEQEFPTQKLQFVLLESAAELMDWRNLNHCVPQPQDGISTKEFTASRERPKILKLVEQQKQPLVRVFCDLSVRDEECDEWDFLGYSNISVTERSRHALARAARMVHPEGGNSPVILIVDDEEERHQLQSESDDELMLLTVSEFLEYSSKQKLLQGELSAEKLSVIQSQCDQEYNRRNAVQTEEGHGDLTDSQEYWSEDEVQQGMRQGTLVKGRLDVTKVNPKEGFVNVGEKQYFVNQRENHFNRALSGDMVVLKPLPESQWGRPIGRRRLVFDADDEDSGELNSDNGTPTVPSARVVAIASHSHRAMYVATLVDVPLHDESHALLVPMDIRIPKIRLATKAWRKYTNQRLLVQVDGWEIGSNNPHGRVVEVLGPIGDLEVEIKCLLIEHEIMLDPFSTAAKACLPAEGSQWTVPEEEVAKRRDLRKNRRIFSVDPPGCQDIDDTMHAEALPNGDIEVGVHIADVTHFVSHNSALDVEAQKRGTTFYLVDRRFDMLPSLLSSDLCSLHGEVDRLAVSVIWTLSKDLETVKSVWYGRTVIHNCQAMTYDQAHNILHNKPPDERGKPLPPPLTAGYPVDLAKVPQLKKDLTILRDLGRLLKKRREELGGAVDLSNGDLGGELKFTLDENGNPVQVKSKQDLEIHHTIAEMMIMANGYVATKIYDTFPEEALLRIHRSVEQSRFDGLKNVLDVGGVALEGSSNRALANTLKKVEKAGAVVNSLIKSLATRAMSEAQYICTGKQKDGLNLSHYGLGVDRYTHFTSPIRRYADVVVHKQLMAALLKDDSVSTGGPAAAEKPFAKAELAPLADLPDSNVISIMAGEGIDETAGNGDIDAGGDLDFDDDDFLDSLIEGASELALGNDAAEGKEAEESQAAGMSNGVVIPAGETEIPSSNPQGKPSTAEELNSGNLKPYGGTEVASIADNLNRQNRVAKHSSMECQNLFLSLYFRDHEEVTHGVVTDLRVNGFFVYIPKFDISGPVYLRDVNGDIQVDPSFVGLGGNAGQPATLGFAANPDCRRFPSGQCTLVEAPDGSPGGGQLEVSVAESKQKFIVRTVDVVTIALRCDNWDVRSRVPPPRFILVGKGSRPPPGFGQPATKKITSWVIAEDAVAHEKSTEPESSNKKKQSGSMFDALQSWETPPLLPDVPLRGRVPTNVRAVDRHEEFKGRMIFHKFINPDTKSAREEAAISAAASAAAQRRANAAKAHERRNEVDSVRQIERNVMARAQRLAAEKRNTRKSKAK